MEQAEVQGRSQPPSFTLEKSKEREVKGTGMYTPFPRERNGERKSEFSFCRDNCVLKPR